MCDTIGKLIYYLPEVVVVELIFKKKYYSDFHHFKIFLYNGLGVHLICTTTTTLKSGVASCIVYTVCAFK